jgi:hypothetical protein
MALDDINRNNSVLPNYDLKSVVYNGMCKSDVVMKAFINVIMNKESKSAIGFLGKFLPFNVYTANIYDRITIKLQPVAIPWFQPYSL